MPHDRYHSEGDEEDIGFSELVTVMQPLPDGQGEDRVVGL